jgi:hypothetical protein
MLYVCNPGGLVHLTDPTGRQQLTVSTADDVAVLSLALACPGANIITDWCGHIQLTEMIVVPLQTNLTVQGVKQGRQ